MKAFIIVDRQYDYAHARGSTSVYTPQAIVNGQVGSDKIKLEKLITKGYTAKPLHTLDCRKVVITDSMQIAINYSITGTMKDLVLNMVLAEGDITSAVKRGENEGKLLQHTNAVRYTTY